MTVYHVMTIVCNVMTMYLQITPHYVKQLEKEQQILENQLRDLEWRLDQESKVNSRSLWSTRDDLMSALSTIQIAMHHFNIHHHHYSGR